MSPVIIRQATIKRPVDEVWDALVNARSIAAWQGGGKARSDARVGGRYAIFDGATTGRYLTVQRPTRLA
ncbi:MAG: hypothetical protein EXR60_01190 [Dehalococcoidia bacterium]|nr:hypothetical protein [Dehalococcoidia bacterium]